MQGTNPKTSQGQISNWGAKIFMYPIYVPPLLIIPVFLWYYYISILKHLNMCLKKYVYLNVVIKNFGTDIRRNSRSFFSVYMNVYEKMDQIEIVVFDTLFFLLVLPTLILIENIQVGSWCFILIFRVCR